VENFLPLLHGVSNQLILKIESECFSGFIWQKLRVSDRSHSSNLLLDIVYVSYVVHVPSYIHVALMLDLSYHGVHKSTGFKLSLGIPSYCAHIQHLLTDVSFEFIVFIPLKQARSRFSM